MRRSQTDFQRRDRNTFQSAYRIEIRNGGAKAETVKLVESVPGDWRIEVEDKPHDRIDNQALWRIAVPANGTVTLAYRVEIRN